VLAQDILHAERNANGAPAAAYLALQRFLSPEFYISSSTTHSVNAWLGSTDAMLRQVETSTTSRSLEGASAVLDDFPNDVV
jgi:hypothetical protein